MGQDINTREGRTIIGGRIRPLEAGHGRSRNQTIFICKTSKMIFTS